METTGSGRRIVNRIVVTSEDKTKTRIMIDQIVYYESLTYTEIGQTQTLIATSESHFHVYETVDEIDALIDRAMVAE